MTCQRRELCPKCEFILARCLCDTLSTIDNQTHLIILQHPSEKNHALNTVRLMNKSFKNISIFIGEDFSQHQELQKLIINNRHSFALLFPSSEASVLGSENQKITHLIFLDGTWKKARKLYFINTFLKSIPNFVLPKIESSQYTIRKSPFDRGLSTLEAATIALSFIEKNLATESLTLAFKKMIDFQIEKMGSEIFNKNYTKK